VIGKVHHIGLAVQDASQALRVFSTALGLDLARTEVVASQGVKVFFLQAGETYIELLEPTDESGPVAHFLRRQGEGVHHICLEVDDLETMLAHLKAQGMRLVDEQPRAGAEGARVAFVHPSSTHGVLIELHEKEKHGSSVG